MHQRLTHAVHLTPSLPNLPCAPTLCRTSFLFDAVNLPAVVNENAVQTLLLNQDRCVALRFVLFCCVVLCCAKPGRLWLFFITDATLWLSPGFSH